MCRFYHGEEQNPYEKELYAHEIDKSHLPPPESMKEEFTLPPEQVAYLQNAKTIWFYEKYWVNEQMNQGNNSAYDKDRIEEYCAYGNKDFEADDGTPISIKALLWNRYYHWGGWLSDQESFRNWYRTYYHKHKINREHRADKRRPKLITMCRYYHGEENDPWSFSNSSDVLTWRSTYWRREKEWVEGMSRSYNAFKPHYPDIDTLEFLHLEDYFKNQKVPRTLISHILSWHLHISEGNMFDKEQAIKVYHQLYLKFSPLGNGIERYFSFYMGENEDPYKNDKNNRNGLFWMWEKMVYEHCQSLGQEFYTETAKDAIKGSRDQWMRDESIPIEYKGLVVYMYLMAGKWFPYDDPDKFAEDYKTGLKVTHQ